MSREPVGLRYYRRLVGAWAGAYSFELTDLDALRATTSFAARSRARSMALLTRLTGHAWMETTLAEDGDSFLHTTRVSKAGLPLFTTAERITLSDDGATLHMAGRTKPFGGRAATYDAAGEVDASATRATYRIPWFGVELIQRTQIVSEGLSLSQETAWMRAAVLLRPERRS